MPPRHDGSDDRDDRFREKLESSVVAVPLLEAMRDRPADTFPVIIDLNYRYRGGLDAARRKVEVLVGAVREVGAHQERAREEDESEGGERGEGASPSAEEQRPQVTLDPDSPRQYVFAQMNAAAIRLLVGLDRALAQGDEPRRAPDPLALLLWPLQERHRELDFTMNAIHRVWLDFEVRALLDASIRTVKCDAAHVAFSALGEGIVWAVLDSGVQSDHAHFERHGNLLDLPPGMEHKDFTGGERPLVDESGHGTHVAGIIAGEAVSDERRQLYGVRRERDAHGEVINKRRELVGLKGMAPKAKLLSLKVLDENDVGRTSALIAALDYVQRVNDHGRHIQIHGVNLSLGYEFDPEWFACGQSPLCREVDRLVRSGVVVVTAAGNTGYGYADSQMLGVVHAGLSLTINDPGNSELAITVGSTHRDSPYVYGVSYFSSKGPTGDGRLKPDLVAPGERILSCAAGKARERVRADAVDDFDYLELSGTSMAAPHVSGAIAAFLSARREFIGQAERVKQIFMASASDLRRERYFQGSGLVDLMRAIQSV